MTYLAEVLADSPVAYFRLGESAGTTAVAEVGDDITYTNTPTLGVAGALTASGDTDTAVRFSSASSEEAESGTGRSWQDLGDVFTVEAWIKRASIGSYMWIAHNGGGHISLYFDPSDVVNLDQAATTGGVVVASIAITDTTTWHHIVVTKNGGTKNLYIDGVDRTGSTASATFANPHAPFYLASSGHANFLDGSMDEFALYPTALSSARVLAHYQAATTASAPAGQDLVGVVNI